MLRIFLKFQELRNRFLNRCHIDIKILTKYFNKEMNFTQFENSPVELIKSKKTTKSNKNEIVELSKDFKNLLLVVNRLNRKVNELEKKIKNKMK